MVDPTVDAGPAVDPWHIVVEPDWVHEATVEVGLYLAVSQSQQYAGRTEVFEALGLHVDDLLIGELTATGGPTYDLDDFDDLVQVGELLDLLDANSVRWTLSRDAHLVVHYNDEAKVDGLIESMDDDDDSPDEASRTPSARVVSNPRPPAGSTELPDSAGQGSDAVTRAAGVLDVDGRPAIDDLTSSASPIGTAGFPLWALGLGAIILVVIFILFLV